MELLITRLVTVKESPLLQTTSGSWQELREEWDLRQACEAGLGLLAGAKDRTEALGCHQLMA